jgi:predicted small secreted protein
MKRLALIGLFIAGLACSMTGCTNTVRGLGQDFDSQHMQNYNNRTASDLDY